jgi:hypothetical protein
LKIDKSFIDGLGKDTVNGAIVRLIVDFAHTLGLRGGTPEQASCTEDAMRHNGSASCTWSSSHHERACRWWAGR